MVNRGVNFWSTRRIFNSKTNNGGLFHLRVKRKAVCAYKNVTNFESCPVQLYKKCLSNEPTEIYLVKMHFISALCLNQDGKYGINKPLGRETLGNVVKKITTKTAFEGHFSNHSPRRSSVTRLYQNKLL